MPTLLSPPIIMHKHFRDKVFGSFVSLKKICLSSFKSILYVNRNKAGPQGVGFIIRKYAVLLLCGLVLASLN